MEKKLDFTLLSKKLNFKMLSKKQAAQIKGGKDNVSDINYCRRATSVIIES